MAPRPLGIILESRMFRGLATRQRRARSSDDRGRNDVLLRIFAIGKIYFPS